MNSSAYDNFYYHDYGDNALYGEQYELNADWYKYMEAVYCIKYSNNLVN